MKAKLIILMFLLLVNFQSLLANQLTNLSFEVVNKDTLREAMEAASSSGYEPTATTNGIRYQVDVLLGLIKNKLKQDHGQPGKSLPLLIHYKDWCEVFISVNCRNKKVPKYIELAKEYHQSIIIDYNQQGVFKKIKEGKTPELVANVILCWPPERGKSFSYIDSLSSPKLQVTNERVITYRLLKFNNLIICDEIKGLKGEALSGFLSLFGKLNMTQYRMLSMKNGSQYVWMRARKWWGFIRKNSDLTIDPKGLTIDDVPQRDKKRLHSKIKIKYYPLKKDSYTCRF